MRNVFLCFLGLGSYNKEKGTYEYKPASYSYEGKTSKKTEFVQVAELELQNTEFDRIIVVATGKSREYNLDKLIKEIDREYVLIEIEEDMSSKGQWKWFEKILLEIQHGDCLYIDLTHGFRLIPIIVSTALNFLQVAKQITLKRVFYGAYEEKKEIIPIIDLSEFYQINRWADAVSRLVENADARKLAELSSDDSIQHYENLNDVVLVKSFNDLTDSIRNVDVNNISEKTNSALKLIEKKKNEAGITGNILLDLVIDKFTMLSTEEPLSGLYDRKYFEIQLKIVEVLLRHRLYMQAFTVMREHIGSLGMISQVNKKYSNADGRKKRHLADLFIHMLCYERESWSFDDVKMEKINKYLIHLYDKLENSHILKRLSDLTKNLTDYRNGFDHAWTSKKESYNDIEIKADAFYKELESITENIWDTLN